MKERVEIARYIVYNEDVPLNNNFILSVTVRFYNTIRRVI